MERRQPLIFVGVMALLAVVAVLWRLDSPDEATPEPTASVQRESSTKYADFGDRVEIGSLDLTIWSASMQDGAYRIGFRAQNVRGREGGSYVIAPSYFKIVDSQGVVHRAHRCTGCVELVRGGSVAGDVWFTLPAGRSVKEITYEPAGRNVLKLRP